MCLSHLSGECPNHYVNAYKEGGTITSISSFKTHIETKHFPQPKKQTSVQSFSVSKFEQTQFFF